MGGEQRQGGWRGEESSVYTGHYGERGGVILFTLNLPQQPTLRFHKGSLLYCCRGETSVRASSGLPEGGEYSLLL